MAAGTEGSATREHARGPEDAPVTLLEYGNYECLHCRRVHAAVEALLAQHGGRVRHVWRHFGPAADFPNAPLAAEAAEAAGAQGRFWEMHAALMGGPLLGYPGLLEEHARRLGLDVGRFRAALADGRHRDRVAGDLARAREDGVRRTPAFFVNGHPVEDARDLASLRAAVAAAEVPA